MKGDPQGSREAAKGTSAGATEDWPEQMKDLTEASRGARLAFVGFVGWYPHPELNGNPRFRKPLLYPFELWGHSAYYQSLTPYIAFPVLTLHDVCMTLWAHL